ncbi:MAG: Holliday junction branch migration protein RuvA [Gammaproteobacteria bacterium]|nr:Holliday junction branch migration protein RuvA [Gammaproteobacteria bacterium]MBU1645073.1 Holliday junction branch migration protein RuvA [Gammaproteobacteria bacterium]MBU1973310.1 Holliday junction branch migration protein RuvA [Gammaproteobacteria bacterium]
MIGRISGTLLDKSPPQITVDAGGIGYEIDVPMSTFYNLPAAGERVGLFTHLVVREDAHLLFGFLTEEERAMFRQVLKISGIGARTALAILSGLSVGEIAQAVVMQDAGRLVKIPGIGKKTAERLLLELKDKLPKGQLAAGAQKVGAGGTAPDPASDILNALLALGYSEREALSALKQLPPDAGVSDGIRQALKLLSKA